MEVAVTEILMEPANCARMLHGFEDIYDIMELAMDSYFALHDSAGKWRPLKYDALHILRFVFYVTVCFTESGLASNYARLVAVATSSVVLVRSKQTLHHTSLRRRIIAFLG